MKHVYLTLSWIFGILLFALAVIFLIALMPIGIGMLAASLFILPPIRNFVYSKTKKELGVAGRTVIAIVLVLAAAVLNSQMIEKQDIDYFHANKEKIITTTLKTDYPQKTTNL